MTNCSISSQRVGFDCRHVIQIVAFRTQSWEKYFILCLLLENQNHNARRAIDEGHEDNHNYYLSTVIFHSFVFDYLE